jgi:ABC-type Fe3+/spermidine/putrescine transport system ATPase subunit
MADILPFKKPRPNDKNQGKTLCRSGFHKWKIVQEKQFDVKQGKLVTLLKCARCGKTKTQAQ